MNAPRLLSILCVALLFLSGCAGASQLPAQSTRSRPARLSGGPPRHVAVIVMENEEYSDIIGARSTPFINALAKRSALATRMFAITHPSLPNYLTLTGGSAFGIQDDCTTCTVPGAGLAGQLQRRGLSWRAYMEDLPAQRCFNGAGAGGYARKHDPFVLFDGIRRTPAACADIVPLTRLVTDEQRRSLPRFLWITPNLCHDMHDCDPATGDRFLAGLVPALLRALGPRSLLVLTWDEGSSDNGCCRLAHGGHVPTILTGPEARAGARLGTPVDHFSVLQMIEDLLGLQRLGGASCACTPSLAPLLRTSP